MIWDPRKTLTTATVAQIAVAGQLWKRPSHGTSDRVQVCWDWEFAVSGPPELNLFCIWMHICRSAVFSPVCLLPIFMWVVIRSKYLYHEAGPEFLIDRAKKKKTKQKENTALAYYIVQLNYFILFWSTYVFNVASQFFTMRSRHHVFYKRKKNKIILRALNPLKGRETILHIYIPNTLKINTTFPYVYNCWDSIYSNVRKIKNKNGLNKQIQKCKNGLLWPTPVIEWRVIPNRPFRLKRRL